MVRRILKYIIFWTLSDPIDVQRMRKAFVRVFVEKQSKCS